VFIQIFYIEASTNFEDGKAKNIQIKFDIVGLIIKLFYMKKSIKKKKSSLQ